MSSRLCSLKQGTLSVAEYSVEFRTVAAETGWNNVALQGQFLQGLDDSIRDELAARDEPEILDDLISLAIRIDNRLWERRRERANRQASTPVTCSHLPPAPRAVYPLVSHLEFSPAVVPLHPSEKSLCSSATPG